MAERRRRFSTAFQLSKDTLKVIGRTGERQLDAISDEVDEGQFVDCGL
jgi:hypothetical protein